MFILTASDSGQEVIPVQLPEQSAISTIKDGAAMIVRQARKEDKTATFFIFFLIDRSGG